MTEQGAELSAVFPQVKFTRMGKGDKKQSDDNKRKRNREAKNEEILKVGLVEAHKEQQYHKIREKSEKKRKLMEEEY